MSIVRYTNKKTGQVMLYESTSYYDPETKQSRPKRKYLGIEDPETGELIPSSGKRGRKKAQEGEKPKRRETQEERYKIKYEKILKKYDEKDVRIKELEHENKRLLFCLIKLRDTVTDMIGDNKNDPV